MGLHKYSGRHYDTRTDRRTGLAGQMGLGVRWRVAKSAAIEIEANAYSIDFYKPGALVDVNGNAGIRFYL